MIDLFILIISATIGAFVWTAIIVFVPVVYEFLFNRH